MWYIQPPVLTYTYRWLHKVCYISCSKPVSKHYHINIRWNATQPKQTSLKCIYQITSVKWNGLKESSCHLFIWSLVLFLLMPMGNWLILFSWRIYCSINLLASAELLLLIYTAVRGESNLEFTAEDLYQIKHSESTGRAPCED